MGLEWDPRACTSNRLLAAALASQSHFEQGLRYFFVTEQFVKSPGTGEMLLISNFCYPYLNKVSKPTSPGLVCVLFFFFLLAALCSMQNFPNEGIRPMSPAVEAWNLNHWTTTEALVCVLELERCNIVMNFVLFWGEGGWRWGFLDPWPGIEPWPSAEKP